MRGGILHVGCFVDVGFLGIRVSYNNDGMVEDLRNVSTLNKSSYKILPPIDEYRREYTQ